MKKIYKHRLKRSEALYHFIKVNEKNRGMFPPWDESFDIIVKGKKIKTKVKVDRLDRIWAGVFWRKLPHFDEGDKLVVSKNPDGSFNVDIEE
jgi:hypothetical protein